MEDTGDIPPGPLWCAIQPPKLRTFTGDKSVCEADDFVREVEQIIVNYKMEQGAAVEWLLQVLAGCTRREVLSRPAVTTASEVLAILKEAFGDQRGLSTLLTVFHSRRQGIYKCVLEYTQSLVMLSTKVNEAKAGTVSDEMLRDRFIDGLYLLSLRRDIQRFVREHDGATFQQVRAEALHWMREDNEVEVRMEQVQVAPS